MVLSEENWVLKRERPRGHLPGSAAEGEVRPPNIAWFCMQFWPPKERWLATYKSPLTGNGGCLSSLFLVKGRFLLSLVCFHEFSSNLACVYMF